MSSDVKRPRRRPSEQTVWQGQPHWTGQLAFFAKWGKWTLALTALAWLASKIEVLSTAKMITVGLLSNGLVVLVAWLIRKTTVYEITNKRVQHRWGILHRSSEESPISRIHNVIVEQNLIERLLDVGKVDFDTAGERSRNINRWWGVRHPRDVAAQIEYVRDDDGDNPYLDYPSPHLAYRGYIEDQEHQPRRPTGHSATQDLENVDTEPAGEMEDNARSGDRTFYPADPDG